MKICGNKGGPEPRGSGEYEKRIYMKKVMSFVDLEYTEQM